ncbi:MAG: hypothetical protein [Caudoviricetes sp.]|nr:MAG: hypothetical protein [Caudoviricetes sp.]
MQLLERMVFHMEQLKQVHNYYIDDYLTNYKIDFKELKTSRPRLDFNNDGKIGVKVDCIELGANYEDYKYIDPLRAYNVISEFIIFDKVSKIAIGNNSYTEIGAIYTNDYKRYVITEKAYKVISRFLYFWEKGKNK